MRRPAVAAGAAVLSGLLLLAATAPPRPPSFETVRARHQRSDALLLDRRGQPLHELRVDARRRVLDWTPLPEISAALQNAVIVAEDRRFYSHGGVDARALAAALIANVRGRRRGGSTIAMQLATQLDLTLRGRRRGRTLLQKWAQLRYAQALTRQWSKPQILEAYLNLSLTRGELKGVAALSRGLFGKAPHGLDVREAAVLTALLREPEASTPRVSARAEQILRRQGLSAEVAGLPELTLSALGHPPPIAPSADAAPEVARRLLPLAAKPGSGTISLRSSLDGRLQRFVAQTLRDRLSGLLDKNVGDAAALVVDNASGEVLAYVGNTGRASSARYVDGLQARRQAGSTLKPFLYGLAFEKRLITPASLLNDSPLELFVGRGLFRPANYDNRFLGPVPARVALASSINVPAVRLLELVGEEAFVSRLSAFGFGSLRESEFYGPSLALGTADVTLWELVSAYRALARGGIAGTLTLTPRRSPTTSQERRALSPQASFLVADVLSDRESRNATFGLDSPLSTRYWTAVKTGTSKDMRDNWCIGFSRRYTVGVWVGNFSGSSMWNVSGISGAAPAWLEIMNELHAQEASEAPLPPSGLTRHLVRWPGGVSHTEWFITGTEPNEETIAAVQPRARLTSPVSGTIIALDPDIPSMLQSVPFEAASGNGLRFSLNGRDAGPATNPFEWSPEPGRYTLALIDAGGRSLDETAFEVRGALTGEPDEVAEPPEQAPQEDP